MDIAPFNDSTYLTCSTKITSWMPLTIGSLLENIPYGMLWSQHYNFGWQMSNHTSSAMPLKESTQLSSAMILHNSSVTYLEKCYSVAL